MSARDIYGWDLDPADAKGVVRGRTKLGQLRVWIIPAEHIRSVSDSDLGKGLSHPGLYVLFDDEKDKAYVGESSDLKSRLGQHLDHAPRELGRFDRALLLNDGRAAVHSLFNDSTLRQALEQATIRLFKDGSALSLANSQQSMPDLSVTQHTLFEKLRGELGHVLYELEMIRDRPKPAIDDEVVRAQDMPAKFPSKAIRVESEYEGSLEGNPVYVRKGSSKPQGLQVTIRVGEPFGKAVLAGKGFLCINRGRCYLIPNADIKRWLGQKLQQQTVDIFLDLESEALRTAGIEPLPVSQFGGKKDSKG